MTEFVNGEESQPEPASSGIKIADIYYVLFRHKWKIVILSAVAVVAALTVYLLTPPVYVSEAKLIIHYIAESPAPVANQSEIMRPDSRGDGIMNTEMEILRSLDLAQKIAIFVGPTNLLGKGGNDPDDAATFILKSLAVQMPGKGNVISIGFQHPNREVPRQVLRKLIDSYKSKHREIHEGTTLSDDFLKQQVASFQTQLKTTEEQLSAIRNTNGIISLEQTKKAFTEELEKLKQDLQSVEKELVEHNAELAEAEKLTISPGKTTQEFGVPLESVNEYKRVCMRLEFLSKTREEYLLTLTPDNPKVAKLQESLVFYEGKKKELEQAHPKLASVAIPSSGTNAHPVDIASEKSRIAVLEKQQSYLAVKLEQKRKDAAQLNQIESKMVQLEREKASEEANLKSYTESLEKARIADALGAKNNVNISEMQAPSPPSRVSSKLKKTVGMILAAGVFGGIGLAFLIELVFDQSVRRPGEVEPKLKLPLFLTIPDIDWKQGFASLGFGKNGHARKAKTNGEAPSIKEAFAHQNGNELAPWDPNHALHPYYETLRDRLLHYFQVKGMTHKPKLVAITSCGKGSGVTTLASGLAASLSETGDGNVLLVDMNFEQGAAHPFYRGKPKLGLPDVFEDTKRDAALVGENLYLASAGAANKDFPRLMPKKFTDFFPKFKASDYDYIIFDMPPVTPTSITPRLAGFMDTVLMIVESEKTNGELAKKAGSLLLERNPNVTAILNKTRTYVPKSLHQEF